LLLHQLLKENYFKSFSALWMVDLDNKEGIPESYLKTIEIEGYLKWIDFKIIGKCIKTQTCFLSIEKECQRFLLRLVQ
jgi:hypothetical protein